MSEAEKKKFPLVSIIRKAVQVLSFLAINYIIFETIFNIDLSIITNLHLPYPFIQTPRNLLFDGKGGAGLLENILFGIGHGDIPFFLIGILILISLVLGRFTCGWICPIGLFQDILYVFQRKSHRRKFSIQVDAALKQVKKWILGILLVMMIFLYGVYHINQVQYGEWRESIGTFIQRPMAGFSLSEFLFYTLPRMIGIAVDQLSFTAMFENGWMVFLFLFYLIVIAVSVFYPRFYCRTLCLYGAASATFSRYAMLKFSRNPVKCVGRRDCGICEDVCPKQIRILDEPFEGYTGNGECNLCSKCVEACPYGAIKLSFNFQ
ncbi:MAG: 4Fe-4S binding protein [Candidatus Lokiarchaeota archaeon]|nr:4Fe-4S binding protein [Candidatus Lokiarchaeota archaeon]